MRGCACCAAWADHFAAAGFATRLHEVDDLDPVRTAAGVPADLGGCHTAKVEGYVVEGHVPVGAVNRLFDERPAIKGISVPGMPAGSPDMFGEKAGPLTIYEIAADAVPGAAPKVFAVE